MNSRNPGRHTSRVLVLLAATAVIAAACGSDSKSSDSDHRSISSSCDHGGGHDAGRDHAGIHRAGGH